MRPYWIVFGAVCAGVVLAALTGAAHNQAALTESLTGHNSYDSYCSPCHGRTGSGDGPVVSGLRTRPADLTRLAERAGGVFPRPRVEAFIVGTGREVPAHGTSDMPIWGPIFRAFESDARVRARISNLVGYLESIQVPPPPPAR